MQMRDAVPERLLLTASVLFAAITFLLSAGNASAEPPMSPAEAHSALVYFYLVVGGTCVGLLALSAGTAALILRRFRPRSLFFAVALASLVAWVLLGWFTGILPFLLLLAAFGGAGRTM